MMVGRAGRWVVGLGQHSADLQHAHCSLLRYGVIQQLWAGISVRRTATVQLRHSASAMDHSSGTATVHHDAATQRHTADRVR
jgi:hypothetical protein